MDDFLERPDGIGYARSGIEYVHHVLTELRNGAIDQMRWDYVVPLSHALVCLSVLIDYMVDGGRLDLERVDNGQSTGVRDSAPGAGEGGSQAGHACCLHGAAPGRPGDAQPDPTGTGTPAGGGDRP
jgi:hypothetical protein